MPVPAPLAAPVIFETANVGRRETPMGRLLAGFIALGCLALLLVAASLQPSHSGMATHRGLGLPECGFYQRTGVPCFACGMTTSFAWFARGNLPASFYVQPMGCLLAISCCATLWVAAYVAATARPIYRLLEWVTGTNWLISLLGFALAAWGWKIVIHLSGHDGW